MQRPRVLYVTYDGLLEPLGQSQVVAYIERLARDVTITVVSFEKPADGRDRRRVDALAARLAAAGIRWRRLTYHKRPPVLSTAWDLVRGIATSARLARDGGIDIVHSRGYVPAAIALAVAHGAGARFLFDMRGFWVDEKIEAGSWRAGGALFRVGKWCERLFLARADAIVSLTHAGVRHLPALGLPPERGIPVEVIPTCVDTERFALAPKRTELLTALGLAGSRVAGSVGTLSNRYLRDDMLRYFACLMRSIEGLRILLVTRDDRDQLRRDAIRAGVDEHRLVLTAAEPAEMPDLVRLFDLAVIFMKPVFAQQGSAATRLAEFLACGVPVVVNDGVADSSALVRAERVGLVLPDMRDASFEASLPAVQTLMGNPEASKRCRDAALRLFDVERGVARYAALYRALARPPRSGGPAPAVPAP